MKDRQIGWIPREILHYDGFVLQVFLFEENFYVYAYGRVHQKWIELVVADLTRDSAVGRMKRYVMEIINEEIPMVAA